ncbi:MAG: type I-E CRISPR-associated protein Cas5/CasD [Nitrospira sp.]|nr:type I-E CRISPR-associated protein Cas5/CasD [Nitrospira sp.]
MKQTLVFRLAGPMQAWGLQSRFSIRDTAREPTKSGVIGLVACALGRPRDAEINDLARLSMGVRVLREGQPRYDFHAAKDVVKASAKIRPGKPVPPSELKDTEPSYRHYLADAWFIVGLEGEDDVLLRAIDAALCAPHWPLFFGRKAFVPGLPVSFSSKDDTPGIVKGALWDVVTTFQDPLWKGGSEAGRVVADAGAVPATLPGLVRRMQPDHPVSFSPRRFLPRDVSVCLLKTESTDATE